MSRFLSIFLVLTLSITSCYYDSEDLILDETNNISYNVYDEYVDEYGNKGIVVYSMSNFIMILSTDESQASWGDTVTSLYSIDTLKDTRAQSHAYGIGILQTMVKRGIDEFPAQYWCNLKNHGRKPYAGSWHLPSYYEIKLVSHRIERINKKLYNMGETPIDTTYMYWTCVEDYNGYFRNLSVSDGEPYYNPNVRAMPCSFILKTYKNKGVWCKKNQFHVRAIKFIYYVH